jgi:hypothetical protein
VKETIDGEWAMVAQFDRHLAMVRATSSEALVPGLAPVVVLQARAPPPSSELTREAPVGWHDGSGLVGNGS